MPIFRLLDRIPRYWNWLTTIRFFAHDFSLQTPRYVAAIECARGLAPDFGYRVDDHNHFPLAIQCGDQSSVQVREGLQTRKFGGC